MKLVILLSLGLFFFYSCKDKDKDKDKTPKTSGTYLLWVDNMNSNPSAGGLQSCKSHYSKNGEVTHLSENALARGMVVNENDVYVYGSELKEGKIYPKYWKNGTGVDIEGGKLEGEVQGLAVSGNDAHLIGYVRVKERSKYGYEDTYPKAKYWKNGTPASLSGVSSDVKGASSATGIAIAGNDVHIVGYQEAANNGGSRARYWVNGNSVTLADNLTDKTAKLSAIKIYGTDVYIAGIEERRDNIGSRRILKYWKNGKETEVSGAINDFNIKTILVSDGNVFIGGGDSNNKGKTVGVYWKNSEKTVLNENGYLENMTVSGSDVYAVGGIWVGEKRSGLIWKNGVEQPTLKPATMTGESVITGLLIIQ